MESSSDDEGDLAAGTIVTEYGFVDERDDPICITALPLRISEEAEDSAADLIFVHGEIDGGLQKIYKQVIAWNVDFADGFQLRVQLKDKKWMEIRKPRKSYQDIIRRILITLECMSYLKMNPSSSEKSLWDHVGQVFSHFEVSPCTDDLLVHKTVVQTIAERDETLMASEVLGDILQSSSKKTDPNSKSMEDFPDKRVEDDRKSESLKKDGNDDDDHEVDPYDGHDHVCAICDNGGDLLCCEGECLRSFHPTKSSGVDSQCKTLCYSKAQVKAIKNFVCPNCVHKKHQCFACGELGNSDKESGQEVFRCMSSTCGHFYHPGCVAKLLNEENLEEASTLEAKISSGEPFLCPVHKCSVCKEIENKNIEELQFAICRRCPKSYHRKCLPRKIAFEESEDEETEQRAWDDLIPDRILIYCLEHEIDREIGTPHRNHITFPGEVKGKKAISPDSKRKKVQTTVKKETPTPKKKPKNLKISGVKKDELASSKSPKASKALKSKDDLITSELSLDETLVDDAKSVPVSGEEPEPDNPVDDHAEKRKRKKSDAQEGKTVKSPMPKRRKALVKKRAGISPPEKEKRRRELMKLSPERPFIPSKSLKDSPKISSSEKKPALEDEMDLSPIIEPEPGQTREEFSSSVISTDGEARKRILLFIKKSPSSSLKVKDFLKRKRFSVAYLNGAKNISNTITHGKVEASVEAIRAALHKCESSGSIEDAKAVCGPDILNQMVIWKKKLKGYLGYFLRGVPNNSTKLPAKESRKDAEIVGRVHPYITDGDMVVDVSSRAEDFSLLAKRKFESEGKSCSFRNYDIFPSRTESSSDKRGWMAVLPKELHQGSQLVVQLDLLVGGNPVLSSKLINKALRFKPKILILQSRKLISRLDTPADEAYDLIWEQKLGGKIAGQDQKPLFLSLWSRPDWTSRHRMIAVQCGHCSNDPKLDGNMEDDAIESVDDVGDDKIMEFEERDKPRMTSEERGERSRGLSLERGLLPCLQSESPELSQKSRKRKERYGQDKHSGESFHRRGERKSLNELERTPQSMHRERTRERVSLHELERTQLMHRERSRETMSLHEFERTPGIMYRDGSRERDNSTFKQPHGKDERRGERSGSLEMDLHRHQYGMREKSGEKNKYGVGETVPPETSPKSTEREKQLETTKMKYHWTCLYASEDQNQERENPSAGPSEGQADSPYPNKREKQAGERTAMRYHWQDLYGRPEHREVRPVIEAPDRWLSIFPSFPGHHQPLERENLRSGPMRNSPSLLERETQMWINEEMPHHPMHPDFQQIPLRGQRGFSLSGGYPMIDPAQSMWEMEQMGPGSARLRPGYGSDLPRGERRRGPNHDGNRYPFL